MASCSLACSARRASARLSALTSVAIPSSETSWPPSSANSGMQRTCSERTSPKVCGARVTTTSCSAWAQRAETSWGAPSSSTVLPTQCSAARPNISAPAWFTYTKRPRGSRRAMRSGECSASVRNSWLRAASMAVRVRSRTSSSRARRCSVISRRTTIPTGDVVLSIIEAAGTIGETSGMGTTWMR